MGADAETRGGERLVLLGLSVGIFVLGLLPWWAMDVMAPTVRLLLGDRP